MLIINLYFMAQINSKQQLISQLDSIVQNMFNMMQTNQDGTEVIIDALLEATAIIIGAMEELEGTKPVKTLGDMVSYYELVSVTDLVVTLN